MIKAFAQMGPDDCLNLFGRIWPRLIIGGIGVLLTCWLAIITAKRINLNRVVAILGVIIATGLIVMAILRSARLQIDLTLLGAEDDYVSESAYFRISSYADNASLLSALKNPKEDVYTKFYIAAILGTRLRQMDEKTVAGILKELRSMAPIEKPRFFTVNKINQEAQTFLFPMRPDEIARKYMTGESDVHKIEE